MGSSRVSQAACSRTRAIFRAEWPNATRGRHWAMYDLVVLGGGSGGLNVATAAARVGARVALVEKAKLGGECTHSACVPSKALIEAARLAHQIRHASSYGLRVA